MSNFFARQSITFRNELKRSLGALVGIAQGLVCDRHLNDSEIHFLKQWLDANDVAALTWPGDVIQARIQAILADGVITDDERSHLLETLEKLIGGGPEDLGAERHVSDLMFDPVTTVEFAGRVFCLTGDFVYAPRASCESATEELGGSVVSGVSKKLNYLVVGGFGSPEWKHGSFGTKIEKAIALKRDGVPISIVHENHWVSALTERRG
jgi:NAD-dependent DNA ligase